MPTPLISFSGDGGEGGGDGGEAEEEEAMDPYDLMDPVDILAQLPKNFYELVAEKKILATVFTNPHWGGGITAALAYHAAIGTFKPSEEPEAHREFYGPTIMVTPEDALEFKANYLDNVPEDDWNDFWGPSNGQIQYK